MTAAPTRVAYPGLDTLRAIASVAVVATHTCFWAGFYGHGLLGSAAQRLEVGVAIFFVLSGFLLSEPYLMAAATRRDTDSAGRYFWKRALRVLPVYWLVVVVALVVLPENQDLGVRRWVDNLLLIDIFRHEALPHGLTQMWSLSTEASFYLALPLLMWCIVRTARGVAKGARSASSDRRAAEVITASLLALSLASIAWIALSSSDLDQGNAWVRRGLPSYFTWFAAGIALAHLDTRRRLRGPSRTTTFVENVCALPGVCWLLAGALFVVVSTPLGGPAGLAPATGGEAVARHLLYVAVAILVVAPSIFGDPRARYAHVMSHRAARHLGHLSYSLFCCHVIVLELIGDSFGFHLFNSSPLPLFVVILIVSLAVSEVLYRVVERPALRLKDLGRRRSAATRHDIANTTSN